MQELRVLFQSACRFLRRGSSGQAMVEFVIIIPLYLLIFGGLIQFAMLINAKLMTVYGAYCAVRRGIVFEVPPEVTGTQWRQQHVDAMYEAAAMALTPVASDIDASDRNNLWGLPPDSDFAKRAEKIGDNLEYNEKEGIVEVRRLATPTSKSNEELYVGETIRFDDYEANPASQLLTVEVAFKYRPIVPVIRDLLLALPPPMSVSEDGRYITFKARYTMRIQTDLKG